MSISHALITFIAVTFPGWGCCHFSFDPSQRALYIFPKTSDHWMAVLGDRDRLSQLDIGIEQFVVVHDDYPATTISTTRHSI
jgi:hypothetical protein